jgi:pimeloyl-ACP methyl ester carboxylesterase
MIRRATLLSLLLVSAGAVNAQPVPLGANLERFNYPHPVRWFETRSQGRPVRMAYMDVPPTGTKNGRVAVLLHGKNFCAVTWEHMIGTLAAAGYRVIAPDQIGFCKSSKPAGYQYSLAALATLTRDLLARAGAKRPVLVGHSTGGMLAMRYALLFPDQVEKLVLVNPLGLNDTLAEGVPYADLGTLRAEEDRTDAASIKAYQLRNYYHGAWRPAYDRWVGMLAGQYAGPDGGVVRDAQARLSDMIQTQPVAHELSRIAVPVTLLIGQEDLTAFRGGTAPASSRSRVRTVPQAAEVAATLIQGAKLIRLPGLGHSPQVEAPERFEAVLLNAIAPAARLRLAP